MSDKGSLDLYKRVSALEKSKDGHDVRITDLENQVKDLLAVMTGDGGDDGSGQPSDRQLAMKVAFLEKQLQHKADKTEL